MKQSSLIPIVALALVFVAFLLGPLLAQHENPNQGVVEEVTGGPSVRTVRGNITPLIWRAKVDGAVVAVPLRSVEYYGVQVYDTDSQTRVHELTICTKSQSLVRIYYILPLGTTNERLGQAAERLRNVAQGGTRQEWVYPIKQYPTTTHTHMVEYRVKSKENVQQLYDSLETAMVEYHARDLIPEQRPQTVRKIEISN
ncbi:MAG: hypothetical protein P1U85_07015 [Verrucomicrobiales bacterium]|nr:hypothetical protein [Verrucomicrobiales bacterium]